MPGINGFDVLKFVRSTEPLKGQKIVVISAMPAADLERALEMGADAVFEKPLDNRKLVEVVSHLANIEVPEMVF